MKASSELLLLDVNVLLAVAWPNHQFHAAAAGLLTAGGSDWATCALTQLGFIRLSANPAAVTHPKPPVEAAALLERLTSEPRHRFLRHLPSPASPDARGRFASLLGHRQVTDAYLLHLATAHRATLVTFDRRLTAIDPQAPVRLLAG